MKIAQRFSAGWNELKLWKSVKRTDEPMCQEAFRISRPFHGLFLLLLKPTDKSVGYYHSSASPTRAGLMRQVLVP
jgi:hypothetical protein